MEALVPAIAGLATGLILAVATAAALARRSRNAPALDPQAELMRQELGQLHDRIAHLHDVVQTTRSDDRASFAELSQTLRTVEARTDTLTNALSNSRVRGQWGERAAEDILRVAGLVENVTYFKQRSVNGARPDFTFPLPDGSSVNMDVKFPIENYAKALDATTDSDRAEHEKQFVRDVRQKIKEVASRAYVDPGNGTVDYVLLFIPSESVYAEINRLDPALLDIALTDRVILCSPLTLFGVLAVVRRSVESFAFQQASNDVLRIMASFEEEWRKFAQGLETLGRQLGTVRGTYDQLTGPRMRALETPLAHITSIRRERGLGSDLLPPELESPTNGEREGEYATARSRVWGLEVQDSRHALSDGDRA